jgi:hypothetical protein
VTVAAPFFFSDAERIYRIFGRRARLRVTPVRILMSSNISSGVRAKETETLTRYKMNSTLTDSVHDTAEAEREATLKEFFAAVRTAAIETDAAVDAAKPALARLAAGFIAFKK